MGGNASIEEPSSDSQYSDAELMECLDEPTDWFLVDQAGCVLTVAISLRHALRRVRMMMSGGVMPHLLSEVQGEPRSSEKINSGGCTRASWRAAL